MGETTSIAEFCRGKDIPEGTFKRQTRGWQAHLVDTQNRVNKLDRERGALNQQKEREQLRGVKNDLIDTIDRMNRIYNRQLDAVELLAPKKQKLPCSRLNFGVPLSVGSPGDHPGISSAV